jgi:hypothetical protein
VNVLEWDKLHDTYGADEDLNEVRELFAIGGDYSLRAGVEAMIEAQLQFVRDRIESDKARLESMAKKLLKKGSLSKEDIERSLRRSSPRKSKVMSTILQVLIYLLIAIGGLVVSSLVSQIRCGSSGPK